MLPHQYSTLFSTPDFHKPPEDGALAANVDYPNENSRDFFRRPLNRQISMYDAWESIAMNDNKEFVIATNKMCGREWCGSIWGFDKLNLPLEASQSVYKLQTNSLISAIKFVTNDMILMTLYSGVVQLWSTCSEVRDPKNPYCLFQVGDKCEHDRPILCADVSKADNNVAMTGSKDGSLKIWNVGGADLVSTHGYSYAHIDDITGVDSSPEESSIFATCGLDKAALLWDIRLPRPATALYDNHTVRFKDIKWSQSDNNQLFIGDESGVVHTVDQRNCTVFMDSIKYSKRPIRKLAPNGKLLAIISDSNAVKVVGSNGTIYENIGAANILRDLVWVAPTDLLTIGYDSEIRKHEIIVPSSD